MRHIATQAAMWLTTLSLVVYQGILLAERPHHVNIALFGFSCMLSGAAGANVVGYIRMRNHLTNISRRRAARRGVPSGSKQHSTGALQ